MKRFITKLESRLFSITITIDSAQEDSQSSKPSNSQPQLGQKESTPVVHVSESRAAEQGDPKYARKLIQILSKDK